MSPTVTKIESTSGEIETQPESVNIWYFWHLIWYCNPITNGYIRPVKTGVLTEDPSEIHNNELIRVGSSRAGLSNPTMEASASVTSFPIFSISRVNARRELKSNSDSSEEHAESRQNDSPAPPAP